MGQKKQIATTAKRPRVWLPNFPRSIDRVDRKLFDTFRGLCRGEKPWPLFLTGPTGTGKTYAALALLDGIRGGTLFTTVPRLRERLFRDPVDFDRITGEQTALAVLDELGVRGDVSDFEFEAVARFADQREQTAGSAAIYISNHPPEEIAKIYDERIESRVLGGTWFELKGDDRRLTPQPKGSRRCTNR